MLIGVVSDTHGFYDPRVPPLLDGVEHILHAGDIGTGGIIEQLSETAPVTAVRGNNDREGPESLYPEVETIQLGGCRIYLTHIVKVPKEGDTAGLSPYLEAGADVVVYGHSHIAFHEDRGPLKFFNPGAAGKRRFKLVPSIGLLDVGEAGVEGRILVL
ncbi:MAG: metallophosphoesterase family protein [SAR202 cluster bacterium]|nr:metallophosphoesterase family protein [SAR202 cluster bacterium]